jgi:hypothetical protein
MLDSFAWLRLARWFLCLDERGEGLLHQVFGFGWVASESVGVIVERGEEGDRELLEDCAAVNGGGHDAKCLGGSGIAERRGEEIDWLLWIAANVDDQNFAGEAVAGS